MRRKLLALGLCGSVTAVPAVAAAASPGAPPTDPATLSQRVESKLRKDAARTLHAAVERANAKRPDSRTGTQVGSPGPAVLRAIAQCESSGDPSARSGPYGGLFQFDQQTWESVGGRGDPAAASPREQEMRASLLYQQRGLSAWPVCGAGK